MCGVFRGVHRRCSFYSSFVFCSLRVLALCVASPLLKIELCSIAPCLNAIRASATPRFPPPDPDVPLLPPPENLDSSS